MTKNYRVWKAPIPVRPRSLFFRSAPQDMAVFRREAADQKWSRSKKLSHVMRPDAKARSNTWTFSSHALFVRKAADEGPPKEWEYSFRYTKGTQREKDLRGGDAKVERPKDQIFRSVQIEDQTRYGLYLPAPASVSFKVTVPTDAVFRSQLVLVPPEAADPIEKSDGSLLRIIVEQNGSSNEIQAVKPSLVKYKNIRIDLAEYAGQEVTIKFQTEAMGTTDYDYVFLANPTIYVPQKTPKRIVMIFIDTLRADEMSIYGYERSTTPNIDKWAQGARVFTQARSVAPWTLPSARTMLSGHKPERWGTVPTIQKTFAEHGWANAFMAGNIYLSSAFDLADDWGEHRCINWPIAEVQIARANHFLQENEDRPVFMMLHLMDMHLPYTEPLAYRKHFAGDRPKAFANDAFNRSAVVNQVKKDPENDDLKQYVRDRYDNNLKYIDDVLIDFLQQFDDNDTVAIFSDHGEEFWDHDGFEHGHTFYDELLRVPMIIRSPNLSPGTIDAPVSLLDLAPTMAKDAGVPFPGVEGLALQDASEQALTDRPQAFGRVLYGDDGWSSLYQGQKYITRSGKEEVYNLHTDPAESKDVSMEEDNKARGRIALQDALGSLVVEGFRLVLNRKKSPSDAEVKITFPQGIEHYWQGSDPTNKGRHKLQAKNYDEDHPIQIVSRWYRMQSKTREVFIVPKGSLTEALNELQMVFKVRTKEDVAEPQFEQWPALEEGTTDSLYKAIIGNREAYLNYAVMPLPLENGTKINAFNSEVAEELKQLGYVDD